MSSDLRTSFFSIFQNLKGLLGSCEREMRSLWRGARGRVHRYLSLAWQCWPFACIDEMQGRHGQHSRINRMTPLSILSWNLKIFQRKSIRLFFFYFFFRFCCMWPCSARTRKQPLFLLRFANLTRIFLVILKSTLASSWFLTLRREIICSGVLSNYGSLEIFFHS